MSSLKDKIFLSQFATMLLQCTYLPLQCSPSLVKYDQEFSHVLHSLTPLPTSHKEKENQISRKIRFPKHGCVRRGSEKLLLEKGK